MLTVSLEPELQSRLEQYARFFNKPLEEIVAEVIGEGLEALHTEKLQAEIAAFERMYPTLKETHFGRYVAVHEGQVVDADTDFESLFLRVDERFGELAALIRRVGDSPDEVWNFRSPRVRPRP